jgi:DNA-binding XRE family transcriptional regulator
MSVARGEIRPMDAKKRKKLEARGWKVGDAKEFLGLSDQELSYIEIKLALSEKLRDIRERRTLTQAQAARLAGSSQSRLAKMEAGDPSVSVDLLLKTLIALGVSRNELAQVISADATAAA